MVVCAFAAAAMTSTAASAGTGSTIADKHSVEIDVHGRIGQHCAMGSLGGVDFGDLNRPGLQASERVQFSCNVPFSIRIQAEHGALANLQYPGGQGPYAGRLDYTLGVAIPLRKPAAAMLTHSFTSRELMGGRTLSSAGGIALEGMTLDLALGRPSGEGGLLAGDYGETITITVAPV